MDRSAEAECQPGKLIATFSEALGGAGNPTKRATQQVTTSGRPDVPTHVGRVAPARCEGNVWRHIFHGFVPIWEPQKIALRILLKNSTPASERCTMAVRIRAGRTIFRYDPVSLPVYPEFPRTDNCG